MLSTVWAGTLVNYPHEMGKCVERDFKKLKLKAASHTTTSWYTDTDWFLEHSPSGGDLYYKGPTLQKIILVFGGVPPRIHAILLLLRLKKEGNSVTCDNMDEQP